MTNFILLEPIQANNPKTPITIGQGNLTQFPFSALLKRLYPFREFYLRNPFKFFLKSEPVYKTGSDNFHY